MPDPTKKTISATQSPGLFGVSPYVTRWLLWQKFAKGVEIDPPADGRMSWGKKLQPLIIQQAAEDLRLEVIPNADDTYHRRGQLGCTRDATIICPDRGPGALETKCVFDYRSWMSEWDGGRVIPQMHEIQLQQQMFVGDGGEFYRWGIVAAWVAGEVHYFERHPIDELWDRLIVAADEFFATVAADIEPDPFGVPVELPWLTKLYPTKIGKVVDLSADAAAEVHARDARYYKAAKEQEAAGAAVAEPLRAKMLALAKDAEETILPMGVRVRVRPHGKGKRITVFEPDTAAPLTVPYENILGSWVMANELAILENQLAPLAPRFSQALAGTMTADRLMRTIIISCERLPKLLECDRQSLFNAAMSAACLGLEVDGVTGQAFLIPFAGKAQLVIGYKGFNTLAARSGITITGAVVRDGDTFDFDLAEGWVKHKPSLDNKGRIIGAWAKASANARPAVVAVMGIDDLMAVKAKSPGGSRKDSPWNDPTIGFPAMCEKTVKRRLARSLPLNVMQLAARLDEAVDEQGLAANITPERGVIIDGIAEPAQQPTASGLLATVPDDLLAQIDDALADAATHGVEALKAEWQQTHPKYQAQLKERLETVHKPVAQHAGS